MKRLMRWWQNRFFKNYVILVMALIYLEVSFRLIAGLSLFTYSMLRVVLGVNIIALFLSYVFSFLPKRLVKIFNVILILVLAIYGTAELGFKNFLGVYASVSISSQAGAVVSYVKDFIKSFNWQFYLLFLPVILISLYYIFLDNKITLDMPKRKKNKNYFIRQIGVFLIIWVLGLSYFTTMRLDFMQNKTQIVNSYSLFLKPNNPSLVINDFGYLGFGLLDIKEYFFPGDEESLLVNYNPVEIPNTNIIIDGGGEEREIKSQTTIDNSVWKDIINKEEDNNYNTLNKYLISNKAKVTNQYTGMFKDKNLIVIMVESGSNLFINEKLYPNMYELYKGSWYFKNYYSPRNSCSTGNNEMSGMIGLYTIYNNCTANLYSNNTYFHSIFNLFNNMGYSTSSYHDYIDRFYDRTTIHKNMGSKEFYKIEDMDFSYDAYLDDWPSDEVLMDERDTDKPFMSWITTVSSHHPYSEEGELNDKYRSIVPKEYSYDVSSYMSKLKTVDNALGVLLDGLKERELLQDTVIVLYADHYPYAIANDDLSLALGYKVNVDNNADNVPFLIYNPSLKGKVFDTYTSYVNVTPTLANLFGLEYDSRLYIGEDIFSDDYDERVIFADGSWKNKIGFYDTSTNMMNYYTKKVYSDEELLAINQKVSLKLKMSGLAIQSNYFSYLDKKLNSYNNPTSTS